MLAAVKGTFLPAALPRPRVCARRCSGGLTDFLRHWRVLVWNCGKKHGPVQG